MSRRWRRLLMVVAIYGIAPASVWPVAAQAEHRDAAACPYQRAREAAAATAAASSAALSLFELSRTADGLDP